jgi:hypothetical protein
MSTSEPNGASHARARAHARAAAPSDQPPTAPDRAGETGAQPTYETSYDGAPEPEFDVVSARAVKHAAMPTLAFDLRVSEPSGRAVYMVALTVQVTIEPARRAYDQATHERLEGLFGPPERWSVTTRSLVWFQRDVLVPAFTGSTVVAVPIECGYDMEVAAAKYLYSLPNGEAPLALHFNGVVYYPTEQGGLQMVLVPWSRSIGFRLPVPVVKEAIAEHFPDTGWVALRAQTLAGVERERVARALPTMDAAVRALLGEDGDG